MTERGLTTKGATAKEGVAPEEHHSPVTTHNSPDSPLTTHHSPDKDELEALVQERTAELNTAIRALHTEIAERKGAAAAARDQAIRLRSVVETAVDGIVVIDERGNIEGFNPAAERVFGYTFTEVLGRNVSMLMPPPYAEEHNGHLARYRATGVRKVIGAGREVVGQRKDGSTLPMELTVSEMVLRDGRKFTGIVRDLSERKKAEQNLAQAREETIAAQAANRAKSEFLSRMSHELRTPLNAILGFSQLLEMNNLTPEQRECVEQINRGGKLLLGLINEALDVARIESGRMDLSPEPIRVADAFQEVVDLIEPLATRRDIRVQVDQGHLDARYVLADKQKLAQVLLNLLSNAVKYNRHRGEVHLSCAEGAPGWLRLAVCDTGTGIAPEKLIRLGVPFERLGADQTGVEGSGLGLALSKNLVQLMGGTMTVMSVVGEGSRFYVELPEAEDPEEPVATT